MRRRRAQGIVRRGEPDYILFFTVLTLVALGIIMVFSASMVKSLRFYGNPYHYLIRQSMWAALGLSGMFFLMNYDCWRYRNLIPYVYALSLVLLVLVLIPGVGQMRDGARRWLGIGSLGFQPAEVAKFTTILFLADMLARTKDKIRHFFKGLGPYLLALGITFGLILKEPDLGTAVTLAGAAVVVLYISGANFFHLAFLGLASLPVLYHVIISEDYRRKRFLAFLDPWKDPTGSGWQIIQALYALGTGGLFGTGVGYSRQKWSYLPQPDTDFIFAVIGEELGFFGTALVLLLFFTFAWRGYRTAMAAPDRYSCLLAAGFTTIISLQAVVNIGVATGSLPITGITLPFVSYGGSSLLMSLLSAGVLLNISRYANR
ncbi:MAG: putative lipid II flippase FtsW [Bacillota bacterium]|nr:putative lipid II flippase FtsW [Bacillota bacterium]HPZ85262.1 putative lipid II flippase FtsW [Bacillota bacterium]